MKSMFLFAFGVFAVFQTGNGQCRTDLVDQFLSWSSCNRMTCNPTKCKEIIFPYSINCYYCIGSQSDCTKERMDGKKDLFLGRCLVGYDRCYRHSTQIGDVKGVIVACGNAEVCATQDSYCKTWSSKARSCKVDCCQKDACNDSLLVNYNFLLLAICIIISLWL